MEVTTNLSSESASGVGLGQSPCSADLIQQAWEKYHGPIIDEGGEEYIPTMPPAFMRGFVDGYEAGKRLRQSPTVEAHP